MPHTLSAFLSSFPVRKKICATLLSALAALFCLSLPMSMPVHAQIATDGTLGPAITLSGPNMVIPQDLGTLAGQNLFHSFRTFGIPTGESATFTGADDIANVISRVTGGEASQIAGLLRSRVGRADFFFINPAGVVFGPGAEVHVPAAFHVSTAHELRFQDGGVFSAVAPGSSTLTQASPAAFGFLGAQRSSIEINGLLYAFAPESTVSFSAGDVLITSDELWPAVIETRGGNVHLTAVGDSTMTVPLDNTASSHAAGRIVMDYAFVDVSGDKGGTVSMDAGSAFIANNATILADNWGEKPTHGGIHMKIGDILQLTGGSGIESDVLGAGGGGIIRISAGGTMQIDNGAHISSSTFAEGNAGGVVVHAREMVIDGRGYETGIFSHANQSSQGNAGAVEIKVDGLIRILDGAVISSSTFDEGDAGGIVIHAEELLAHGKDSDSFTGISSSTYGNSAKGLSGGNAGTVEIKVDGLMQVLHGSAVVGSTWAEGDAGSVVVHAGEMLIDGRGSDRITGIASSAEPDSQGNAGAVRIDVDGLMQLLDGASISSATFSRGNAGSVVINTRELIVHNMDSDRFTGITSQVNPNSRGNGGMVEINVEGLMQICNGAMVLSSTFADGDAGDVLLRAGELVVDGRGYGAGIFSHASQGSHGNGGTIEITIDGLMQILDGAAITSMADTHSTGNAGNIMIHTGELLMDGKGGQRFTGIANDANPFSDGNAGTVEATVGGLMQILDGARIVSDTYSTGNAGNVTVRTGELIIDGRDSDRYTGISSDTENFSQGDAGTVEILSRGPVQLFNGGEISTETHAKGDAGDVIMKASNLSLHASRISSAATPESTGHVGNITIDAGSVSLWNNSAISIETHQTLPSERPAHLPASTIFIDAHNRSTVTLDHHSRISTASSGNVPASDIVLRSPRIDVLGNSRVTTSSIGADGGAVTIGAGVIFLHNGLITTSVEGLTGDGGDITIGGMSVGEPADFLIMKHGFIQANTAAPGASGGNIGLHVRRIIDDRSGGTLVVDALDRMSYHANSLLSVIQAAAPGGTKGEINLSDAAILDISGSIIPMRSQPGRPLELSTDPCDMKPAREKPSSLILGGY